ncbi:MAG: alpha/beta hydrolase [Betaproteobacteria bacterium]|nr:alpha/beta hydrolase [Betaproteobacteria bacterium]
MLWNVLGSVAIAYAAMVALLFVFQSRLIYFPETSREIAATPQAYGLAYTSHDIRTQDGETLHSWWIPASIDGKPALGIVLLFHGNAGNISHRLDYARMFNQLGYACLLVDYRGYGQSSGTPSEEGTYRDALAAWQWLGETRGAQPQDIVVAGESLGGAVASWLAVQRTPRALLLMSAFTSVPDLAAKIYPFFPVRLISRFNYDNLANLRRIKAPVLVAHSREDEIVPFAHGEALFAATSEPKQFLELRGGHNEGFVFAREDWVRAVDAFLRRHAPGAGMNPDQIR